MKTSKTFSLNIDILAKVEAKAKELKENDSWIVETALRQYLK